MEPLTATINGFTVPATRNATNFNNPQGTPTPAPQLPNNQIQSQVITPAALKPEPQINIPVAPTVPQVAPTFTNEADRILQQSQVEDTQAQQLGNKLSERIFSSLQNLTGEKQALGEAQQAAGVGQFKQQLQDINSQILKKQAELQQDDIRLIQSVQNLEQQKIPMEFITGQQQSVQRDAQIARALKASEIGILNASALATQGNIALAMETAQQAVDLKYAPYKEEIALYKSQLEALAPILSRDEKKQAREQELKANLALKDLETRQANDKAIQDLLINASAQDVPQFILDKAKLGKTPTEVAAALGSYAGDVLGRELKLSQIAQSKLNMQETKLKMSKIAQEIQESKNKANQTLSLDRSAYPYGSKEYVTATILNSSGYDKGLDQDQRNSITAATRALNSVDILTGVLNGTKKLTNDEAKSIFGDGSGIVQGRLRTLAAGLGGDADAAAINAIITGLIPTVARGIFGEVGVLTDQDIANYRRTVPNLNSPENVNTLVSLVLADTAQKMIGGTLTTAANNRQNVSGFRDDYLNSIAKSESIRSNLGQLSSETTSKLDDVANEVGVGGQTVGVPNNSASGLLNSFLGIKPIQLNN